MSPGVDRGIMSGSAATRQLQQVLDDVISHLDNQTTNQDAPDIQVENVSVVKKSAAKRSELRY